MNNSLLARPSITTEIEQKIFLSFDGKEEAGQIQILIINPDDQNKK